MSLLLLLNAGDGAYVVSLTGYTPSARFDGVHWASVLIEESATEDGTVLASAVGDLDPVDDDPTVPQPRNFTMTGATLAAGWYRVTFLDAAGNQQPTAWVFNGAATDADLTPSVADVAALLLARTRADDEQIGEELGTFNTRTRPTAIQVAQLIAIAVSQLRTRVATPIPTRFAAQARSLVALNAAALVEGSLTPEQSGVDNWSTAPQYQAMYLAGLQDLIAAIRRPSALRLA